MSFLPEISAEYTISIFILFKQIILDILIFDIFFGHSHCNKPVRLHPPLGQLNTTVVVTCMLFVGLIPKPGIKWGMTSFVSEKKIVAFF